MPPSRLDAVYRSILLTKFFTKGWGNPQNLKRIFEFRKVIANRETCYNLIPRNYPINITKDEQWSDCHVIEGSFTSPFDRYLSGMMPEKIKTAYFQVILPHKWDSDKIKPICLHLAGTGDHQGFGPLGLTGLSMGGHMASLAATNWPKPIVLVPCLSWSTASPVFTEGVMSASINWNLLENQYFSDETYQNDLAKMVKVIDEESAFLAGQHFAKHYPASMNRINRLKEELKKTDERKENLTIEKDGKANNNNIDNNSLDDTRRKNKGNNLIGQAAEEKSTAKLFSLNLISNKLKSNDFEALKVAFKYTDTYTSKVRRTFGRVCSFPVQKHPLFSDGKWREREALQFMRGIMDECTHLKNFEVPVDTELIIAVCARNDAYVPRDSCMSLEQIWPGVEIRYIDAGHVSAYLLHQKVFRSTIAEAFQRSLQKYPLDSS
ncbi:protein ABHD18 isoform X5 [Polistes fuscatus]|uniref:protein ABHD18 isoform X5 n=1 Tax=Polistes fuscatus TaxID=30207 RepID=UPI001CA9CB25|nr:protein ABHD18 isoform X5 [Polistes fuscatus]